MNYWESVSVLSSSSCEVSRLVLTCNPRSVIWVDQDFEMLRKEGRRIATNIASVLGLKTCSNLKICMHFALERFTVSYRCIWKSCLAFIVHYKNLQMIVVVL